jgi:hypothetical protein
MRIFKLIMLALAALSLLMAANSRPARSEPAQANNSRTASRKLDVATYHYDNLRTGWNSEEYKLSPGSVQNRKFGLLKRVILEDPDEQIDAQPLYVSNQDITKDDKTSKRDVIYVVTSRNNVYAIDANSQSRILRQSLGPAVPIRSLPGECHNNGNTIGILSTPVIVDSKLYMVSYQQSSGAPAYYIYALNLANLDVVARRKVEAARSLPDGETLHFTAAVQRQRAGLLAANGNIYAAFASFCDLREDVSRGWILGWSADKLAPISQGFLTNTLSPAQGDVRYRDDDGLVQNPFAFYLSSIWMSGYGIAADNDGDLYFVTGNSTKYASTFNPPNNLQNSVVRLSNTLTEVKGWFSPSSAHEYPNALCFNAPPAKCYKGVSELDNGDLDFGSGGVMLLPDQSGNAHLAVAAGKVGQLFLLNRDRLGGYGVNVDDNVLQTVDLGGIDSCYCGPSYYETEVNGFHTSRVVTSVGNSLRIFDVTFGNGAASLSPFGPESAKLQSSSPPTGFFTTISSNSTTADTAIIWAVSRPVSKQNNALLLYAFDPNNMANPIFKATAGSWPNTGGKPNIVPVVADGRVFVGSYGEFDIFGLDAPPAQDILSHGFEAEARIALPKLPSDQQKANQDVVFGKVVEEHGKTVIIKRRNGESLTVDAVVARENHLSSNTSAGKAVEVVGHVDENRVLHATSIKKAQPAESLWDDDSLK